MDVCRHHAAPAHFHPMEARDADVLADFGHLRYPVCFKVGLRIRGKFAGDIIAERSEVLVASHEIRFAIHFQQNADFRSRLDELRDDSFIRFAAGLFGGGRHTLLAQNIDGCVEVAVRFA